MGTSQNIGNLNVTVSGDATGLVQAFNQAMDQVDASAEKIMNSVGKIDAGFARAGLTVIGGARLFSEMHREILNVIENIDSIPGVPASTIQSVHVLKASFEDTRTAIDQFLAGAAGVYGDANSGVGLMLVRALYGADAARVAFTRMNEQADIFSKYTFNPKAVEAAEKQLATAKQAYDLIGAGKADSINKLFDASTDKNIEANAMPTYNGQKSVESARAQVEAQQLLNRGITENLALRGELQKVTDRLSVTEGAMYGAVIPKKDLLNSLSAREWDLKNQIYNLEQADSSPQRTEALIALKTKLLGIEEKEVPLLKAQQKAWDDMGKQFSDSIQEMILSGNSLKDTWHKIVKDMEADLVKSLIGDGLKNFFSGLAKGLFTGTGSGAGASIGTSIFGLFAGHAGGGNVSGPTLVGETGTELFVPSGSGMIMNNDSTRALGRTGKGGGDTYHIDARGADQAAVARLEATIKQVDGSIESRSIQANITYNRRVTPSYNPSL